jgi:hypothetical protein
MNRIKINLALVAMVLGCTMAVAFKAPVKPDTDPFWAYDGSGSVTDPSNYVELPGGPMCHGTTNICAIEAPAQTGVSPAQPSIDSNLATRITNKNTTAGDVILKN